MARTYLTRLIQGEAAGSPEGIAVHSDEQLEQLLASRLDGAWVEMGSDDFRRMRENLSSRLDMPL